MQPTGSIFLDNTTFNQAINRRGRPTASASASLARVVEALAIHERVFVLGGIFEGQDGASLMASWAPDTVQQVSPDRIVSIHQLREFCERLSHSVKGDPHHSDLSWRVEEILADGRITANDVQAWAEMDRRELSLRDAERLDSVLNEDVQVALLSRTLLYYLSARSLGVPYSPHVTRTELLLELTSILGPVGAHPTKTVMDVLDEIRKHHASLVHQMLGVDVVRLEMPLFLSLALDGADNLHDVIQNALKIRNLEEVVALRHWCSSLMSDMTEGRISSVVKSLQELQSAKETLMKQLKPGGSIPLSLGWPPGVSVQSQDIRDFLTPREPLCLLRDILLLGSDGAGQRSLLGRLSKRLSKILGN